ncbi:MAG: hypothetical protein FGM14_15750 [Flavobacteriales bacterium]|nr:hypothetical protein [Flavobacteriales bacterium]
MQQNTLGNIGYEITNYPPKVGRSLGNVNVVISDRKIWNTTASAFKAVPKNYTDYFPFACPPFWRSMEISSRTSVGTYRYGYNGMEQDPEAKGEGNSYTTEFRQYDPRLGRWLSLDPKMTAWESPFVGMGNNPIFYTDPFGDTVKFERFRDRVNVFISKTFNKEFREKNEGREKSLDVFTYKKGSLSGENLLTNAEPDEEFEDKMNDNEVCYSESNIFYDQGMGSSQIDNKFIKASTQILTGIGKFSFGIPSLALAIPFGIFTGIYNAFAGKKHEIGWGFYLRVETIGGMNILNIGLGDYKDYNMYFLERGKMFKKSQMHPDDCILGFRYGLGRNRPTQMIEFGEAFGFRKWDYRYNLLGVLNVRKSRYRSGQPIWMFRSTNGGNLNK